MLVSYPDVLSPGGGTRQWVGGLAVGGRPGGGTRSTSCVAGPWLGASGHRRLEPREARRSQGCARDGSPGVVAVVAAAPRHRGRAVRFVSCPLVRGVPATRAGGGFAAL